jgi:cardiolipin synthase|tara:strand:+ start:2227 stop:2754 length:528 start_codon:yes stop_codon:yes gene_type:complete
LNLKDLFLLPNLITIGRLFFSIYLFTQHLISDFSISILVLIIALIGISDSIDGIVARRLNQVSRLGTILDPVCDRIVFLLLLFWLTDIFPDWFFYGILIRETLVILGSLNVLTKTKTLKVSNFGKFGTVLIFFSICFFVINSGNENIFFTYFGLISLIFYYFVALEYFYKIFIKK